MVEESLGGDARMGVSDVCVPVLDPALYRVGRHDGIDVFDDKVRCLAKWIRCFVARY